MPRTQFTGIGIHLKVADVSRSREFYEGLGFSPAFGYGDEEFISTLPAGCDNAPERYRGVTYRLADHAELEIADGHVAVDDESVFAESITSPKVSGMIRVRSVVPIVEKLGSDLHFPVSKYYWGSIEVAVRDPDGFVLVFIAPYSEEELAAVQQFVEVVVVEPAS